MIYFVEAIGTDRVKIGYTVDLKVRLNTLQTGCPHELKLIHSEEGNKRKERELHKRFFNDRTIGEWFEISDEIREYIRNGWKGCVRNWIDGLPVLYGVTSGPVFGDNLQCCHLVCQCPSCGVKLIHGFQPGPDFRSPSHRVSHCNCHYNGYFIDADDRPEARHEFDPRRRIERTIKAAR